MKKMSEILDAVKIPAILVVHDMDHLMGIAHRICFFSKRPTTIVKERSTRFDKSWRKQDLRMMKF
jgi:hypothetical protein